MLIDHDVFIQAVKTKSKIILTFFSGQQSLYLTRLCVPIEFNRSDPEDISGCYYFWDPEAEVGERLLVLRTSEIAFMELSDETFDPADYIIPEIR
ncbi:MAG: hypothetical protein JW715_03460 [Sedimentisphaerales bacterium]|nr:hypothetical protein [Sedimentisphaerales bacterium]